MAVAPLNFTKDKTKTPWWTSNKKIVTNYIKQARTLASSPDQNDVAYALHLLDQALALSPGHDVALDLKARSLLHLRRFNDVAELLHDYIPSAAAAAAAKTPSPDSFSSAASFSSLSSISSTESSRQLGKERARLLSSRSFHHLSESKQLNDVVERKPPRCFSIADLRNRISAGTRKKCDKEGQWRYLVLGQALCHLGLMEDAMILLQTGKRLASAAFRRESICRSDDSFSINFRSDGGRDQIARPRTDAESVSQLIAHIKLLLRRKTAALAALDAGLYTEAVRYFTKIVEGRRCVPQGFLAECYMHRASGYRSAGRLAESISDCNRTLALDPTCIEALQLRASILESLRCLPDCLHDLEHLKLLYNSILRDRKLPGPVWRHRHNVSYREIPGHLCLLATKIQKAKQNIVSGNQAGNVVDYYSLIGLSRGCSRVELQRSHLLLSIKHKPDKAVGFLENCEFADECDIESAKDRAKLSALMLYRLLQKGYKSVMASIELADKQSKKCQAPTTSTKQQQTTTTTTTNGSSSRSSSLVFQGVFCRDIAVVGSLVSQAAGCNRQVGVKSEGGLSG